MREGERCLIPDWHLAPRLKLTQDSHFCALCLESNLRVKREMIHPHCCRTEHNLSEDQSPTELRIHKLLFPSRLLPLQTSLSAPWGITVCVFGCCVLSGVVWPSLSLDSEGRGTVEHYTSDWLLLIIGQKNYCLIAVTCLTRWKGGQCECPAAEKHREFRPKGSNLAWCMCSEDFQIRHHHCDCKCCEWVCDNVCSFGNVNVLFHTK